MSEIYRRTDDGREMRPVSSVNPFPVALAQRLLPPIEGRTVWRMVQVPGIGTGAAYADGDAFGGLITFPEVFRAEKRSGVIVAVLLFDLDDEGLALDMPLFARPITPTADNGPFALSDDGLLACRGAVAIPTAAFWNWGSNQLAVVKDVGLWVQSDDTNLYTQLVARGALNIAAGAIPWLGVVVLPD